jgi:hypothetical protein
LSILSLRRSADGARAGRRGGAAALGAAGVAVLAVAGAYFAGYQAHGTPRLATVGVLHAARNIVPGTLITADELAVTQLATPDSTALSNLVLQKDQVNIVGHVAAVGVLAGYLVPANVAATDSSAALWQVNLPVRRLPSTLAAGDHVAVLALRPSDGAEVVVQQDVQVVAVQSSSADLLLAPGVAAQMQWDADHGGIVLVKMPPGTARPTPLTGGPQGG